MFHEMSLRRPFAERITVLRHSLVRRPRPQPTYSVSLCCFLGCDDDAAGDTGSAGTPLCALHHSFVDQRGDSSSDIGPRSAFDQY
jgi:hypothetical protein